MSTCTRHRTSFLKVNAFAARFCGYQEADETLVEAGSRTLPRSSNRYRIARELLHPVETLVPIDESRAVKPESAVQGIYDQGLSCLIFCEDQYRFIRAELLANHVQQAFNLGFAVDELTELL